MRKSRCTFIFMFVVALFIAPLHVQAYTIPDPSDDLYVSDFANVIDSDVEQDIIDTNMKLEEKNGVQIAVVTVDFLDGAEIEEYAYELFNQWGIGSAESNNGVLLLLAIGEDNYYCLAGSGLSNILSSGRIKLLLNEYLEPDFANGDYSAGVSKTFDAIYDIVKDTNGVPIIQDVGYNENETHRTSLSKYNPFSDFLSIVMLIGILFFILLCVSAFTRPRTYRRRPHMRGYFGPTVIIHDHHDHYDSYGRGPRPPRGGYGGHDNGYHSSSNSSSSGSRSFGGGAGRSSGSSFGGGRSSGAGRSSSSGRSFGGGSSRGGGAGRK